MHGLASCEYLTLWLPLGFEVRGLGICFVVVKLSQREERVVHQFMFDPLENTMPQFYQFRLVEFFRREFVSALLVVNFAHGLILREQDGWNHCLHGCSRRRLRAGGFLRRPNGVCKNAEPHIYGMVVQPGSMSILVVVWLYMVAICKLRFPFGIFYTACSRTFGLQVTRQLPSSSCRQADRFFVLQISDFGREEFAASVLGHWVLHQE